MDTIYAYLWISPVCDKIRRLMCYATCNIRFESTLIHGVKKKISQSNHWWKFQLFFVEFFYWSVVFIVSRGKIFVILTSTLTYDARHRCFSCTIAWSPRRREINGIRFFCWGTHEWHHTVAIEGYTRQLLSIATVLVISTVETTNPGYAIISAVSIIWIQINSADYHWLQQSVDLLCDVWCMYGFTSIESINFVSRKYYIIFIHKA